MPSTTATVPLSVALRLAKHALLDINHLLAIGFDQTWRTTQLDGVKDTVQELAEFILKHDPKWMFPD